jgi:hypothetical protein
VEQVRQDPEKRKFVWAPTIKGLGERVAAAEKAAEEAREFAEDVFASDDLLQRIAYLVLAVRDFRAGTLTADELFEESRKVLDGIRESVPDEFLVELGSEYARGITGIDGRA